MNKLSMRKLGKAIGMISPEGKKLVKVAEETWLEVKADIPVNEVIERYRSARQVLLNKEKNYLGRTRNEIAKMLIN
jgi:hypothetical protein